MTSLLTELPGRLQSSANSTNTMGWRAWRLGASLLLLLWWLSDLRSAIHGGSVHAYGLALSSALLLVGLWELWRSRQPTAVLDGTLAIVLLALFLPEHLAGSGRPMLQQLAPTFVVFIALLAAGPLLRAAARPLASQTGTTLRLPALPIIILVCVYFLAGTSLAVMKLHCFGYVGQDVAYFMQCLYTGAHGHLFWANQYHDLLYSAPVWSDFAGHNQPVLFLLVPFYALAPHAETLFVLRNLLLAIAVWPAFRLLRLTFAPLPAAILTAAFLLTPAVLFQNFYDYAPLSLVAVPLLCVLLFYAERRFALFLIALLGCLIIREDLVIALLGMAAVALIQRRSLRWILTPAILGVVWGFISWHIVMPHFLDGAVSAVQSCFAYLGSTPLDILRSALLHPRALMTRNVASYGKEIFSPFLLGLPFFSPFSLISLPYLAINILGDRGCDAAIVFRHYALIPSIFLLPSVSAMWRRWIARPRALHCSQLAFSLLLLGAAGLTTVLSFGTEEMAWFRAPAWQQEARDVARSLPAHAAVAVPRSMLPLVANRDLVYQSARLLQYHHPDAEFVVVDRDPARMGVSPHIAEAWNALRVRLADPSEYHVLSSTTNYVVYRRVGPPPPSLAAAGAAAHE